MQNLLNFNPVNATILGEVAKLIPAVIFNWYDFLKEYTGVFVDFFDGLQLQPRIAEIMFKWPLMVTIDVFQ